MQRTITESIKNKFKIGFKLLFSNPKELLNQLRVEYKKLIINIFYSKDKKVTNNGERFDPLLTTGYFDKSHLPRYEFAKSFITKADSVLDIASGTGYGTEMLAQICKKAYGVDISSDAVNYAKEKRKGNNLEYYENDLYKNTLIADIVVSFETIEHIPDKEIEETIEKLLSYSNKLLIGSYPYKENEGNNPHHFQFNLDENNLNRFKDNYKIKIYYQDINGIISTKKEINDKDIQNLIFIIKK